MRIHMSLYTRIGVYISYLFFCSSLCMYIVSELCYFCLSPRIAQPYTRESMYPVRIMHSSRKTTSLLQLLQRTHFAKCFKFHFDIQFCCFRSLMIRFSPLRPLLDIHLRPLSPFPFFHQPKPILHSGLANEQQANEQKSINKCAIIYTSGKARERKKTSLPEPTLQKKERFHIYIPIFMQN